MDIFAKWNKDIDTEGLKKDIKEAVANNGTKEFEKVPYDIYEVKVEKMELRPTKRTKEPMVSVWFKILEGKYKNQMLFMNQKITQGFQIHIANEFLKSLGTDLNVEFEDYSQYNDLLMDIHEAIEEDSLTYALKYEDNKGYDKFTITEVYEG